MAITLANVRTNTYTTFYNHLQTGAYAISTDNIHPSYNRLQRIQEDYPQVIINEPIVGSATKLTTGRSNNVWEFPITVNIDIYEDSALDAKALADEIMNKLITGRSELSNAGFKRLRFESDTVDVEPYSQVKTLHTYTVSVSGIYKVSA